MESYDVAIVGAGPAGLFAAQRAGKQGMKVIVLEKQAEPGEKLLLTGSGQCNYTNHRPLPEFVNCYGEHGRFLKPALYHFTNLDSIQFFQNLGIDSITISKNQKVFPKSKKARDVLNALLKTCLKHSVALCYQEAVQNICHQTSGLFEIRTAKITIQSKQVILATGGMSYPSTGSTGDGYALAKAFGHSIIPPKPGLAPFVIKEFMLGSLAGSSFEKIGLTVWKQGKKSKTLHHDLVITHQGISGPVVHHMARYANPGDTLTLNFLSLKDPEMKEETWMAAMQLQGKSSAAQWLKGYAPTQALATRILKLAEIAPEERLEQVSKQKHRALFTWLQAFPLEIEAIGSFEIAMVTCGGVNVKEVNAKTMESRLVPGLYFVGEVLDIDGDTGGYDLQACWSTAALAADHIFLRPDEAN
jgi:predicted Rossmann fold flavoprotein